MVEFISECLILSTELLRFSVDRARGEHVASDAYDYSECNDVGRDFYKIIIKLRVIIKRLARAGAVKCIGAEGQIAAI